MPVDQKNAELIYVEQMIPKAGNRGHIYWSSTNFFFGEVGGYAGIQHQVNTVLGGVPFVYNNICSIWDDKDIAANLPTYAKLTWRRKGLHSKHFGGEGTGLHTSHPMPWQPDEWYSSVIKRWYKEGEQVTRMGFFMYSYIDNKWTLYMTASIPRVDIPLTGDTQP